MAGNASNWYKPQAGPLKGQSVYLSKVQQLSLTRGATPGVLAQLEAGDRAAVATANALRPEGTAKRALPPTGPLPRPSRVTFANELVADDAADIFGHTLSDEEWLGLTGAPAGAKVAVSYNTRRAEITVDAYHPDAPGFGFDPGSQFSSMHKRTYARGADGRLVVKNDLLHLNDDAPAGAGTAILARQVRQLSRMNAAEISTSAAGPPDHPGLNGYYTWPRLGYDAPIPGHLADTLPLTLNRARRVSDLMQTSEGRSWWKTNGEGLELTFDLAENSRSRQVLEEYMREKGIAI